MLHEIQVKEGVKFANKLSDRHINYQRLKMKVNVAGQTLSSPVADAIEYLMKTGEKSGDTKFEDAGPTIEFIKMIDELFDLLNSKNLFATGYKTPLKMSNVNVCMGRVDEGISNLKK